MGDCGRTVQVANCATVAAQDMSDARDIVRRFEQLETQWMSFQKRSAKLEGEKDSVHKSTTSPTRNHLQKCAITSAASSYSNPLFTNHSTAKAAQTIEDNTSPSSSRASNLYAVSGTNSHNAPLSCFRQKRGALATSPRDASIMKDDRSSSLGSPSASIVGSSCQNSEKAFKDGQVSHSSDANVARATMATSFRNKPPLGPVVQTIFKSPIGNEKYVSCSSSITRHTFGKWTDHTRKLQSGFKQQEILGQECPLQSSLMTRSSHRDDFRDSNAEIIESLHSMTYPPTSDSGTYSTGNGPSESHLSSPGLEQSSDGHVNQSRSPPSAPPSSGAVATSQLSPLLGYDAVSDRNISWRVLGERGVLSEGTFKMDRHPSECKSEEEKLLSIQYDKSIQNVTGVSSKDSDFLKPDAQVEKKVFSEAEHEKPSDRLDKHATQVKWELRLSKREAALRIAEEKLLEEEQSISEARLAVSRCEDSLRDREQNFQRESEKQKIDLGESLKSIETGKTVIKTLCTGLRDVLWHIEQKEKVLQNSWLEVKDSLCTESGLADHLFGFEPELPLKDTRSGTFAGISFLTAEGKCEEWCSTVVGICERLATYMSRETHLQKWAIVLEREGTRMGKMSTEMAKAKEATNEQCARSEDMMKCAEEQEVCMEEERVKLARERDNLILWVTHLQERRKAVRECEREAAKSLADVQKKAADLFAHESNIDERALEISALQEELRATSQRLRDDQELNNREKQKVQEKLRLVAGREREVESQFSAMKMLQEDLNTKSEQMEKDRVDEKERETLLLTFQETEERIKAKEMSVRELEKELEHRAAVVEEMTSNINGREKRLAELQVHLEQERSRIEEVMTGLEEEKVRLMEAEEAVLVANCSKKNAEEAWARTTQERRETSEYLRSVEDRLKQWEDKLLRKERELQGQQKKLQEIENQAKEEQEQSEALHAKLVEEQESWTQELKAKQESLTKRNRALDAKDEEINNDLDRLTEERRVALEDIERLAEMESRAWGAERDLQAKHEEHLKEVRKHANDYKAQVEELALAKRDVKREFEELRAKKQELKIWQREAEETLQNRIDSFVKGKEELTAQIKELKKLQTDIEQAGSQIIDRVAELDQASSRLERQRHKVETSKKKLEALADKLATHQEVLKRRECEFLTQESKLVAVQNGLKKMAAEAATREKNLRCREQAVIDSENDLHDVEARLANERKDLEKMLAEVEQHAAKLKEEATSVEEISRSRTRDELLIEERREQLQSKERELTEFEIDLKKKAKSLEEHGLTLSKLEMQVKERLQRAVEFETKSEELQKGWKQIAIHREAQNRIEGEIQSTAENNEVQRQGYSKIDEGKAKADGVQRVSESNRRESQIDCQHVSKELQTEDLLQNKMDEAMEDRLKHMEEAFQKETDKISQERANLKIQQQDLEVTRKAVEEVKLTLESQLKATKDIVAGASLTAQNASREREALEEERKRLAQERSEADTAAAAKEEELATKAKHLETMKSMLEQEKAQAMDMIQQAAKKAMRVEHAMAGNSRAQRDSMMLHKEIQCEESLKDREKELFSTAQNMRGERMNLNGEREQVQFLDDTLEREQMVHPHVNFRNSTKVGAFRTNAENHTTCRDMENELSVREATSWKPTAQVSPKDRSHVPENEFSFSTMRSASEIIGACGDFGERSGSQAHAYHEPAHYAIPKTEWDEVLGSANPGFHATYAHVTSEKLAPDIGSHKSLEKSSVPSQKRLENVMTSLMQARQASRSRLQRTKNALLAFPPSSGFTMQVQQALNALSARLCLMEQIEEGLESHLRSAYETDLPESERILVDKVQLLCRMEEQQSLRVEWEEDMQRQLETISMLQAASGSSPNFTTPPRDRNQGASQPVEDWQNHSNYMYEDGKGHIGSYEMLRGGGNADVKLSAELYNGGVARSSKQYSNLNWSNVFEPSDGLDSPSVAHQYLSNVANERCNELGEHQRCTRRKLILSSPQVTYS